MTPAAVAAFAALRATRDGIPADIVAERLRQELVALELLAHHHGRCPAVAPPRFDVDGDCGPSVGRAGYDRHRKLAEEPCRSCLAAARKQWAADNAAYKARKKGRVA